MPEAFGAGVDGVCTRVPARSETSWVDCPVSDDAAPWNEALMLLAAIVTVAVGWAVWALAH